MFKIWYEDYVAEGNNLEDWNALPNEGVVGIYQTHGFKGSMRLGTICEGCDWYWMTVEGLIEQNNNSADEPNEWVDVVIPEGAIAKKGKWVSDERMAEVHQALMNMAEN